jgi:hypothetical protein
MSEEKVFIHIEEDSEGNIEMHAKGKGASIIQVLASVIDDDADFKQMVELALALVKMKNDAEDEDGGSSFMNPPVAEA